MAEASLYYLAAIFLVILCGLAWLSTLLTLPGNWFVVGLAALFAWWFPAEAGHGIAWQTVGIAAALAAVGEAIEFAAGAAGAAKHGAKSPSCRTVARRRDGWQPRGARRRAHQSLFSVR